MVSTFTPNIQIEEPARGDDVGTWDTPVNNNSTLLDLVLGGINTISLNNSNVVLSAAQFQSKTITFISTLTGSVTITFPTSFVKSYEIFNLCTGSSAFIITLATSTPISFVCPPPGQIVEVLNSGPGGLFFKNLPPIGSYMDYAGSSLPNWVTGCSKLPYLNCDGTAFSSATYPALATIIGTNSLPDARGRSRFALDQGVGRVSTGVGGFNTPVVGGSGGSQTVTLGTSNLPPYTPSGTVAVSNNGVANIAGPIQFGGTGTGGNLVAPSATFTGIAQGGVSAPVSELPPAYIGGLTLIRAG